MCSKRFCTLVGSNVNLHCDIIISTGMKYDFVKHLLNQKWAEEDGGECVCVCMGGGCEGKNKVSKFQTWTEHLISSGADSGFKDWTDCKHV